MEIVLLIVLFLILSLVFSILLGCLKIAVKLFFWPVKAGWWLMTLPFRILFG